MQAGWVYLDQYGATGNLKFSDLARSSFEKARQLGMEKHPIWLNAWGAYLSRVEGRHAESEGFLRQASEGGISTQYVHLLLASGLPFQAQRLMEKHLALYPFETADRLYLSIAYGAQGQYEEMLKSADLGISYSPDNGVHHAHRAYALMRLGRFSETRSAIKNVADIEGIGSWPHRDLLAHLAVAEGNHQLARETARDFAADGGFVSAGLIHAELGDPEGEEYLRNAMHAFYVYLPFRISQMSDRVKNNEAIIAGIEDYGYNTAWRLELCRRSAKVDAEAHAQCTTGDLVSRVLPSIQ